ncbi:phage tail tape measure protein [Bacillus halotolerans]|uniref:phage tail tape measure protein n=1 Tax=Bacillus halotolerans TaxID=260554 RepID=UPI001D0DD454|nr:phage tail tape measure protein [Bacillus halotolerans]MCC2526756.1 phage tail tape measure protein [Bacillus halotolerans]
MGTKDIRMRLYSQSSEFRKDMSDLANKAKTVKSEFEKNKTAIGVWGNAVKQSQTKINYLNSMLEINKNRVKTLERAYQDAAAKKGKDAKETEQLAKQTENLGRRLNYAKSQMNKTQNSLTETTQRLKQLEEQAKRSASRITQLGNRMDRTGTSMRNIGSSVAMTTGAAFAGLALPIKDAITVAMDFEKQMSGVKAISGATASEFGKLKEQAMELGAKTAFTATQAGEAQQFLAMAGFKTNQILEAMPGMLDLAAAGQLELANAADITSNIMSAFALKASSSGHAADVIAYAAANANTNVEQMGEAMKYLAPNAHSLGWGMEESAAAIMAFGDAGLQGSIAGQAFGTSLIRLASPSRKAAKEIDNLGFQFFDAAGNMKSLPEVIDEMEKGMKGLTKEQKAATLKTIVGAEAYKHWAVLLEKGSKALDTNTKKLKEADGAAKKMADTMLDNARGSVIKFQSALEGAKINISNGLLPAIGGLADKGSDLLTMFNNLDKGTQAVIGKTAVFAAGVLGVTAATATLTAGIGALLAFTGPVGLAIVGGTALLGGLSVALYAASEQAKNLQQQQEETREKTLLFGEGVSKGTQKAAGAYVDLREKAELQLFELSRVSGQEADKMASKLVETYSNMRDSLIQELEGLKKDALVVLKGLFNDTDENTKKQGEKITDKMVGAIDKDAQEAREKIKELNQLQKETGLVSSKMNAQQRKKFDEIVSYFELSTSKFAANQKEALAMQKAVTDQQGQLSFKQAKQYNEDIKKVYDDGQKAAKKDFNYRNEVIEKLYAQGYIEADQRKTLLSKSTADYNTALAKNTEAYEKNSSALFSKMSRDGKLLDLETGKALDRQDEYISNSMGIMIKTEESESAYQERWANKQIQFLQSLGQSKEEAIATTQQALEEFYRGVGMTQDEARAEAEKVVSAVESEMNKPNNAEQAGKNTGDSFAKGVGAAAPAGMQNGTILQQAVNNQLASDNSTPAQAGAQKGNAFSSGLRSTQGTNTATGSVLRQAVLNELGKNGNQASAAGSKKGNMHNSGLSSTKGKNTATAGALSTSVSNTLAKTTDGGGGKKAGAMFSSGVNSQKGSASNAGKKVSSSAKTGMKSVKTNSVGQDFVTGFINGMGSQNGSIFSAAWKVGKAALSALKKSIDSHSPSKLTKAEGHNFTDGLAIGIDESAKTAQKSATSLGKTTHSSLQNELGKMAFNIKTAADELLNFRSELVVKSQIETPTLTKQMGELIALLSNSLTVGSGQQQQLSPIVIQPAAINVDGKQLAQINFKHTDNRKIDQASGDRLIDTSFRSGVRV